MKINPVQPRYVGKLDLTGFEAGGAKEFPIPRDRFIDRIVMKSVLGTLSGGATGSWNTDAGDAITKQIRVLLEGSPVQDLPEVFYKLWGSINEEKIMAIGTHNIYFKCKLIPVAGELPAWDFTSVLVQLEIEAIANLQDGDRTSWGTTYLEFTLFERAYAGESLEGWKLLRAKIPQYKKSGNNETGEFYYELDRVHTIYVFMFGQDDDGTLTDEVFDRLWLIGQTREREYRHVDNMRTREINTLNDSDYKVTVPAGLFVVEFPNGIDTAFYTTLKATLNIPTAIGVAGLRVAQFYVV